MRSFSEQILPPGYPQTPAWGYGGQMRDAVTGAPLGDLTASPSASFEATRHVTNYVKWVNTITTEHMFAIDPTLHWANPNDMEMPDEPFTPYPPGYEDAQTNVPLVTHLHGGEVQSTSDGGPEAWWTASGDHGPTYSTKSATEANAAIFEYPNDQLPTTLWYHDHALGVTRTNVMSGLAGFYLLRDPADTVAASLPNGAYDVPLVFQDRIFKTDGSFWFDEVGVNQEDHPYWMPEFFGNTIMVNGLVWPNMNVDKGQYMFRLLDGSNARFYSISFSN
jgi:FtsP/CotA-like multicopper oxidase with cupredoxin domain